MSTLEFSQLLGNYGEFVGAIAIVVTLIYLAVQLKQNTASVKANAYQEWVAANIELNMTMAQPLQSEAIATGSYDPGSLTQESSLAFAMWHMSLMQMTQATEYLRQTGSLDDDLAATEINRAAAILSMPGVRQWWDAGARTQLTPQFVKLIESTTSNMTEWKWEQGKGFASVDRDGQPDEA